MTIQQAAEFISKYGGDGVPTNLVLQGKKHSTRKLNLWKKGMLLRLEEERIRVETAFTRLEQHYESNKEDPEEVEEEIPKKPSRRRKRKKKKEDEGLLDRIFFGTNKDK